MLIGEISKKIGLSKDTIRFYEKKGLLKVNRTTSKFNNYKQYTAEHLSRLQLVKKAKRFGFTLKEIGDLLELKDANKADCSIMQKKVKDKLMDIDRRIQELEELKSSILFETKQAEQLCRTVGKNDNCKLIIN